MNNIQMGRLIHLRGVGRLIDVIHGLSGVRDPWLLG